MRLVYDKLYITSFIFSSTRATLFVKTSKSHFIMDIVFLICKWNSSTTAGGGGNSNYIEIFRYAVQSGWLSWLTFLWIFHLNQTSTVLLRYWNKIVGYHINNAAFVRILVNLGRVDLFLFSSRLKLIDKTNIIYYYIGSNPKCA